MEKRYGGSYSLAEILEAFHAATSGTWIVDEGGMYEGGKYKQTEVFVRRPEDDMAIYADVLDPVTGEMSEANARFAVVMHNVAYDLICAAARLEGIERGDELAGAAEAEAEIEATLRECEEALLLSGDPVEKAKLRKKIELLKKAIYYGDE